MPVHALGSPQGCATTVPGKDPSTALQRGYTASHKRGSKVFGHVTVYSSSASMWSYVPWGSHSPGRIYRRWLVVVGGWRLLAVGDGGPQCPAVAGGGSWLAIVGGGWQRWCAVFFGPWASLAWYGHDLITASAQTGFGPLQTEAAPLPSSQHQSLWCRSCTGCSPCPGGVVLQTGQASCVVSRGAVLLRVD